MGFTEFSGFVAILRESIKVLSKNGHAMATIAALSILLHSLLLFTNVFTIKAVIHDLVAKETLLLLIFAQGPRLTDLLVGFKKDIRIILGVESAILVVSSLVSLVSMGATIIVSSTSKNNLTSKHMMLSRLARSCVRSLVTTFHIALFLVGYIILVLAMLILIRFFTDRPFALKFVSILFGIVASLSWIYLSVVWLLGLVVSVIEESCYGIEALGRAGGLVKGKRLHGFALNFLFAMASVLVFEGCRMIIDRNSLLCQIILGVLLIVFYCLVSMFQYMTFTVLYFQCKKADSEEIELQGSLEYSKLPSIPLDTKYVP
ncbi:Potassium/sodium hyperpolarization-activated cyclic nucleotide-gated channel 1 like [Actinidia chinensis var. chinensis]|uniref:Potassium/sodium hyperpolarization-activated cyclic nucleotide-gated channel 1 like n=1 Tax=Actinidia chinensis var. chinensis TaxID=1590841 RepID=A0A2R6R4X8_ACTCC|nr:Potassium/sodium hyperpolarization-activated cyclic nucleotide-gated channel 1 like [Actinidia chinensis var. chinensis]